MKKMFFFAAALLSAGMLSAQTTIVMDGKGADWNGVPMLTEPGVSPVLKAAVNSQAGLTLPTGAAFSIMVEGVDATLGYPVIYTDADMSASTGSSPWFCPSMGYDYEMATWSTGSTYGQEAVTEMTITTDAFGTIPFSGACSIWLTYGWGAKYLPTDCKTEGYKWSESSYTAVKCHSYNIADLNGTHTAAQVYAHHPVLAPNAEALNFNVSGGEQDIAFWASWAVELKTPGVYAASYNATSSNNASCDLYLVDMATNAVVATLTSTDTWQAAGETTIGNWDLSAVPAGKYMLKMKNHVKWSDMQLKSITLSNGSTAIENNTNTVAPAKKLVNGQVMIKNGEKWVNVLGK